MSRSEAILQFKRAMQFVGETLTDEQAIEVVGIYPTWRKLCDTNYYAKEAGYRFRYKGDLYKTKNAEFTFQNQWIPGIGTESIFERIDVTHAGTAADPIPYEGNMELFAGKHYTQYDVLYLCTRDTSAAAYHDLSALVGIYVEVVE